MGTNEENKAVRLPDRVIEGALCKNVVLCERAVADAKRKLGLARKELQDFRDRDEESRQMKFEFADKSQDAPKGPTCKEFADAMGHDQAKTMGVTFSDEPLSEWQKRNDEWRERRK